MAYTTIQIDEKTRERLSELKASVRETYDQLLNSLLDLVPSGDDEGAYTREFRASLLRALSDVKNRRTYSSEEVRRHLGIKG